MNTQSNLPRSGCLRGLATLLTPLWTAGTLCAAQLPDPVVTASATPYNANYSAANLFGSDTSWPPKEFATKSLGPVSAPFTRNVNDGTWVEFDFGVPVTFNQFIMRSRPNTADIVMESRLIISPDPGFDTADTVLTFNPSGSNGTGLIQSFAPVTGRYVRWEVTQGTVRGNLGAAQMWFMSTPPGNSVMPAPAVIDSATPFNPDYAAGGAVNGDVGNGGAPGHEYACQGLGSAMYVDFDFGSAKAISGFDFWNRPVDVVTAFDLIFADTPDFGAPLATRSFTASANGNQVASAEFEPVTARYVRFQATANQGGQNTGINEIQFYTPGLKPPEIVVQPAGGTQFAGLGFGFSVQAVGALPLFHQWWKGAEAIAGATNSTLMLRGIGTEDAGDYTVVVSNSVGSLASAVASLVVLDPPADTASDLVLHLKFDETDGAVAADASPLGNHATLYSFATAQPIWVPGRVGGALEFNRAEDLLDDDLVLTDYPLAFANPDVYSFAFWAKPHGYTTLYNPRVLTPFGLTHWVLWKPGSGVGLWPDVPVTPEPADSVWRHFAVVYDRAAGTYAVYVDGVLRAEGAYATRADPSGVSWAIGHPENTVAHNGDSWRGALDDVRIYNRILSPKDIRAIYDEAGFEPVVIAVPPFGGIVYPGENFLFVVNAGGTPPLAYQWQKDGLDIPGATSSQLALAGVTAADAGDYTVVVSNAGTSATSPAATLVVSDPPVDLAAGLVLHLKLDESTGLIAEDASGTGNAGDLLFFPFPNENWVAGALGGALEFNSNQPADNQVISVPGAESLDFAAGRMFSLAFWVKGPAQQKESGGLLCKGLGGGGEAYCIDIYGGCYRFFVRNGTDGATATAQTDVAPHGAWQLLGLSFDQALGRMRVYVDGVEVAAAKPAETLMSNTDPLDIGCRQFQGGYTLNFVGLLDDLRVYNRALTPKEHRALHGQVVPPEVELSVARTDDGVVIQWPAEITGAILESRPAIEAGTWLPVPGVVNNRVTVALTGGAAFYRLRPSQ
ncbi:MAG TPA: hypothetical protein PKM73_02820 [Verrucomicrobiota bacterium]|nr:hypothetical protein [Verrucomicrobiota bacterium]HNU49643.1 hypothetical protein [Verrucomicrobiota bacterium]